MIQNLNVPNAIDANLQAVSAGNASPLSLSSGRVQVTGGGSPPLFVQGSPMNYAMIGLQGDGSPKDWQIQGTNTGGTEFRIAYSQNDPKLVLSQNGDLRVTGAITATLPKLPAGSTATDVVVGTDGKFYRKA